MPFQQTVSVQPPIGVPGDWCGGNPRSFFLAGPGGLVAGAAGLTVARAAWTTEPDDSDGTPSVANNFGAGLISGILHRQQQAFITAYLGEFSNLVPGGFQVALCTGGDLLVQNDGTTIAEVGMKAYADLATGKFSFAATGSPAAGATASTWSIAAETNSFAGSISDDVLTVTGAVTGTIYAGTQISGTGVAANTAILAQLTGTAGGDGTYRVNIGDQNVASTTISGTYGLLTLTTVATGNFAVNDSLTGGSAGVTAGTTITQFITGTGGSGSTAAVNFTQTSSQAGQGTLTAASNVETKWYARSTGQPGEPVKISAVVPG